VQRGGVVYPAVLIFEAAAYGGATGVGVEMVRVNRRSTGSRRFLDEFRAVGLADAKALRSARNGRTINPLALAAEVRARKTGIV